MILMKEMKTKGFSYYVEEPFVSLWDGNFFEVMDDEMDIFRGWGNGGGFGELELDLRQLLEGSR